MINYGAYETVIGLEVHAQLQTNSKLFCGDSTAFGAEPNTQVSAITLAHPGTLPKMNRKAIEYAVKMGLACHCDIVRENYFARKNYFYPDLPKGYQVSQHTTPVCKNGFVRIQTTAGEKNVQLNRIHLEEDAGKSIHPARPAGGDAGEEYSCIDYNRAGTPLIEIVTEPNLASGEEAFAYLVEIRKLVRYLSICDGNMEEGSLRCDANISVRKKGEIKLGTKTEIKNLNSIRNVKRAIESESKRLIEVLEKGGSILQQTRGFDPNTGSTFAIREKEDADDYRYFPEPDLAPFHLQEEFIEEVRRSIPALQADRVLKYTSGYELSPYDAAVITEDRAFADYFEEVVVHTQNYKAAANWMLGPVKTWLNEHNNEIDSFPLPAGQLTAIITLVDSGAISFSAASGKLLSSLVEQPASDVRELAEKNNLIQQSDVSAIGPIVDKVLEKFADKVTEYKKGKRGLLALFVGEVMKQSKGKADPKTTNELLMEKLKS